MAAMADTTPLIRWSPARRRLLAGLAAGACVPRVRGAPARIGVLAPAAADAAGPLWEAFVQELARRGQAEGRTFEFVLRVAADARSASLDRAAAELVAARVDVLYALGGTPGALAAQRATSTIPVVFYSSADPVGFGLVRSLSQPGGNLTGNAALGYELLNKGVGLLAEAKGDLRRLGFLLPADLRAQPQIERLERTLHEATSRAGGRLQVVEVAGTAEIEPAARSLPRLGCDGAMVFDYALLQPHLARIAQWCIELRLPAYGWAWSGFLLHYNEPRWDMARTAARMVDRILRGARPAELPVEQVSTFDLTLNLRTARAIGLTLPRTLLARANELIE